MTKDQIRKIIQEEIASLNPDSDLTEKVKQLHSKVQAFLNTIVQIQQSIPVAQGIDQSDIDKVDLADQKVQEIYDAWQNWYPIK